MTQHPRVPQPQGAPGRAGGSLRLPEGPEQYRQVLDQLHEVVFQTGPDGTWTYLNAAWEDVSGYGVTDSLGRSLFEIIHPDDEAATLQKFDEVVNGPATHCYHDLRIITKTGTARWLWLRSTQLFNDDGDYIGNVGTLLDIDERKQHERAIRREAVLFERLSADAPLEDVLLDITNMLVDEGAYMARVMAHWEHEDVISATTFHDPFAVAADAERTQPKRSQVRGNTSAYQPPARNISRTVNAEISSRVNAAPMGRLEVWSEKPLPDDVCARAMMICRIAIERQRSLSEARHRALHDPLTGLPNRILLEDRLKTALAVKARRGGRVALLVIDIIDFRLVNDSFGHFVGDAVLVELAARLADGLRSSDTIARLGGDDFAVVVPAATDDVGIDALASLLLHIIARPLKLDNQQFYLQASIGIAISPEAGRQPTELLRKADVAMYHARQTHVGHARYDESRDESRLEGFGLAGELRQAIREHQLVLQYQPIVELAGDELSVVRGVECLVRWKHPNRGLLGPNRFIPIAETTGVIWPLTEWVIDEAMAASERWSRHGFRLAMSINLSARLLDSQLRKLLNSRLTSTQREHIVLELTETGLLANSLVAAQMIDELQAEGYSFAIDDFGTGYASLSYLRSLPVQTVKIDHSFVSGMNNDPRDASIVRSSIELAHELGIRVVAEGVESAATMSMLADLSCDLAQGYHIGHPMAEAELLNWLQVQAPSASVNR